MADQDPVLVYQIVGGYVGIGPAESLLQRVPLEGQHHMMLCERCININWKKYYCCPSHCCSLVKHKSKSLHSQHPWSSECFRFPGTSTAFDITRFFARVSRQNNFPLGAHVPLSNIQRQPYTEVHSRYYIIYSTQNRPTPPVSMATAIYCLQEPLPLTLSCCHSQMAQR